MLQFAVIAYDRLIDQYTPSSPFRTAHHAILLLISAKRPTFRPDATADDYDYFVSDSYGTTVPSDRIAQDN